MVKVFWSASSLDSNGQPELKADGTQAMQLRREIYNYLLVMLVMMQKVSPDSHSFDNAYMVQLLQL